MLAGLQLLLGQLGRRLWWPAQHHHVIRLPLDFVGDGNVAGPSEPIDSSAGSPAADLLSGRLQLALKRCSDDEP